MFKIRIRPQWMVQANAGEPRDASELRQMLPRLLELLSHIHEDGNLARACRTLGVSYRYAWGLIRDGAQMFGAPLVETAQGHATKLTGLGERLLWADRRITARLAPILDSLASEVEVEIQQALTHSDAALRIHASHGFAVETMRGFLLRQQIPVELKYRGSLEALASLSGANCDLASFHVPIGALQEKALAHYAPWLKPQSQRLIMLATRRQGIMVPKGNPADIMSIGDLARPNLRFVNRQTGSGTRMLLDLLLEAERLDGRAIRGYDTGEFTHAAVAAYIASGMADAGFGVETAARHFNLGFVPIVNERYFLICTEETLQQPVVRQLLAILVSKEFRASIGNLPGYDAEQAGQVMHLADAFPEHYPLKAAEPRPSRRRAR